eukprot:scaffold676_cov137-Skeletonema_marinoi.AAC.12
MIRSQVHKAIQPLNRRVITSLPAQSVIWDSEKLLKQDEEARKRAQYFFSHGVPNKAECKLLATLLQKHNTEIKSFPYLFLYEWSPSNMMGRGDAVFASGEGGLVVVEAKAKHATKHVTKQSLFYRQRLLEEYPHSSVSAAILTHRGFAWTQKESEQAENPVQLTSVLLPCGRRGIENLHT